MQLTLVLMDYVIVDEVTPNDIVTSLGVTGLEFRNWLQAQKALGHALLAGHEYRARYPFTSAEAVQLAAEYSARTGQPRHPSQSRGPRRPASGGSSCQSRAPRPYASNAEREPGTERWRPGWESRWRRWPTFFGPACGPS